MVEVQILSKVLETHDISIIQDNQLTAEFFPTYPDEYAFIMEHYNDYDSVPDKLSFLSKFPEFDIVEVNETDEYLVDTIIEENLYYQMLPIVQNIADLVVADSNKAIECMLNASKQIQPHYKLGGVDIVQQGIERLNAYKDKKENQDNWFFTTGFPELDDMIHGIKREEEFFVIFARTNQGKSWILEKICTHVWELGFNVGYISPEMGALSVGYRFDTLYRNFSNRDLMWGNDRLDQDGYKQYVEELKAHNNKFMVATPGDFNRKITVTKLKQYIKQYKLDLIAIDGITYLTDERFQRGDNKTTSLTNISEDLMSLSIECGVPVLVVVQANRNGSVGKDNEDTPELESIRDSDGIAHNASKVISIKQNEDGVLILQVKKQRDGKVGGKLSYQWNPDIGEFISSTGTPVTTTHKSNAKKQSTEKEDVF